MNVQPIKLSRVWAMPNRWTFKIKPIRELLERYDVGDGWLDPFAGQSRLAEYRNDLNSNNGQPNSMDATKFLDMFRGVVIEGVLFDPPYSPAQVSRSYRAIGQKYNQRTDPTGGFTACKNLIAEILPRGKHCISFGWHSNGMSASRGFEKIEILLVAHGASHNDTIVTVEQRL